MLDLVKNLAHKGLGADDPGVVEIPATISETIHPADPVFLLPFLLDNLRIYALSSS